MAKTKISKKRKKSKRNRNTEKMKMKRETKTQTVTPPTSPATSPTTQAELQTTPPPATPVASQSVASPPPVPPVAPPATAPPTDHTAVDERHDAAKERHGGESMVETVVTAVIRTPPINRIIPVVRKNGWKFQENLIQKKLCSIFQSKLRPMKGTAEFRSTKIVSTILDSATSNITPRHLESTFFPRFYLYFLLFYRFCFANPSIL
jgi:hypothetical protein